MKKSELKQIIREELKNTLNEANALESKVANLYAFAGIKTAYTDDLVERYGQKVVDLAIKMAPKILAYKSELEKIVKDIENSPEAKMLLQVAREINYLDGGRSNITLGNLIDGYASKKKY
jgi:hypothetical protein